MVKSKSYSRNKGRRAEYQVRDLLNRIDPKAKDKYGNKLSRRTFMSGAFSHDGDVSDNGEWSHEVKAHESINWTQFWSQTISQTRNWQTPVLWVTANYRPMYAVMREKDYKAFAEQGKVLDLEIEDLPKRVGAKKFFDICNQDRNKLYRKQIGDETMLIMIDEIYLNLRRALL